jgi:hypothetical protein
MMKKILFVPLLILIISQPAYAQDAWYESVQAAEASGIEVSCAPPISRAIPAQENMSMLDKITVKSRALNHNLSESGISGLPNTSIALDDINPINNSPLQEEPPPRGPIAIGAIAPGFGNNNTEATPIYPGLKILPNTTEKGAKPVIRDLAPALPIHLEAR